MAAGRRTSLASLAGEKVDDVPGKSDPLLLSLPLSKLVPTRFNPRRRFGTEEELREFGEKLAREQLQPAVVVSRAAYLKLWPEEAEHVGDASYVIANGERRYRASRIVGRPTIEVVHKEDVASSRAAFLDAVQSENNDRADLDPIERALGIDIMVTQLGGADQVAVYYGKTKGWVSQQRKLLKLTPDLQDLVSVGELPIRVARDIAGLPQEVQATAWDEEKERRKAAKEAHDGWSSSQETRASVQAVPETPRFTAVNQTAELSPVPPPVPPEEPEQPSPARTKTPERFTAVNQSTPPQADVPDPKPHLPEQQSHDQDETHQSVEGRKLPYDDGYFIAHHLIVKMPDVELQRALRILNAHASDKGLDASPAASA
ncbi:ParB/RepB/Spo0J family partition protein [Streptomyces sp. NPDC002623]